MMVLHLALKELNRSVDFITDVEAEKLVTEFLNPKKIFVADAGRYGFMSKSFAMGMMHMGINSYIIGETVTDKKKNVWQTCQS